MDACFAIQKLQFSQSPTVLLQVLISAHLTPLLLYYFPGSSDYRDRSSTVKFFDRLAYHSVVSSFRSSSQLLAEARDRVCLLGWGWGSKQANKRASERGVHHSFSHPSLPLKGASGYLPMYVPFHPPVCHIWRQKGETG